MHGVDGDVSGEAYETTERTNPRMHSRQSCRCCVYFSHLCPNSATLHFYCALVEN